MAVAPIAQGRAAAARLGKATAAALAEITMLQTAVAAVVVNQLQGRLVGVPLPGLAATARHRLFLALPSHTLAAVVVATVGAARRGAEVLAEAGLEELTRTERQEQRTPAAAVAVVALQQMLQEAPALAALAL